MTVRYLVEDNTAVSPIDGLLEGSLTVVDANGINAPAGSFDRKQILVPRYLPSKAEVISIRQPGSNKVVERVKFAQKTIQWVPKTVRKLSNRNRGLNPYVFNKTQDNVDPVNWTYTDAAGVTTSGRGAKSYPAAAMIESGEFWTAADDQRLVSKLMSQVKTHQSNAAVTIAEGNKTINMISHRVKGLAMAVKALKHGDLMASARFLGVRPSKSLVRKHKATATMARAPADARFEQMRDNWLELRYGWQPLISDVFNLAEAAASRNFPVHHQIQVRGSRTVTWSDGVYDISGNWVKLGIGKTVQRRQYIVRLSEPVAQTSLSAMGLLDPLPIAWELMPYSFVADWFLPIGQWLEDRSVSSLVPQNTVTCYTTFEKSESRNVDAYMVDTMGGTAVSSVTGNSSDLVVQMTRSIVPFPIPSMSDLWARRRFGPSDNAVSSCKHSLDALALSLGPLGAFRKRPI